MILFLLFGSITCLKALVPQPLEVKEGSGTFILENNMQISYCDESDEISHFTADFLAVATGYEFKLTKESINYGIVFVYSAHLGGEEYNLDIDEAYVKITASAKHGFFYGVQTFLQLLPPTIYSSTIQSSEWTVQCVNIHDKPRFSWRGVMLDTSRHFFDINVLKRLVKVLAFHKINIFHLHINDDQGWRMEVKKYPLLIEIGSKRSSSPKAWDRKHQDGVPYGPYFYTQDELRDLVKYAKSLCVTVVPEIELPGHSLGALSAYPDLSCTGGPFEPMTTWGVTSNIYCAGNDRVFEFLQDVFDEVFDIFDSKYIHIGGDEADKAQWKKCPKCAQRIQDEGLKNYDQLQSWFIQKMQKYIESKGRKIIGWDEVLDGGISKDVTITVWRDAATGLKAAKAGHDVIMAPDPFLYLSQGQTLWLTDTKFEYSCCYVPASKVYGFDPVDKIPEDVKHYFIGTQVCLWAEYLIFGEEDMHWKLFPRTSAFAEMSWTSLDLKDFDRMKKGYNADHKERLAQLGVNFANYFE